MKRPAFLTAAAAALLAAATASAQTPTVEARIVPDSIGIGDTFTLEIDVERDQVQVTEFPLYENDDKLEVVLGIHGIRQKPDLDRPYFGHIFSDEDKKNLLETGNMGRVVELKGRNGEYIPSFISVSIR